MPSVKSMLVTAAIAVAAIVILKKAAPGVAATLGL